MLFSMQVYPSTMNSGVNIDQNPITPEKVWQALKLMIVDPDKRMMELFIARLSIYDAIYFS